MSLRLFEGQKETKLRLKFNFVKQYNIGMSILILKRPVNCLATSLFRNTGVWLGQSQHRHYWKHQIKHSRSKEKTGQFQLYHIYQIHRITKPPLQRTMKHLHRGKLWRNSASWGSPKRFLYGACSHRKYWHPTSKLLPRGYFTHLWQERCQLQCKH